MASSLLNERSMIVSALVVTLSPDPALRAVALQGLRDVPGLTLGEPVASRLPVVAEARSAGAGAALCEGLAERPGVVRVDVVAIDFEDDDAELDEVDSDVDGGRASAAPSAEVL